MLYYIIYNIICIIGIYFFHVDLELRHLDNYYLFICYMLILGPILSASVDLEFRYLDTYYWFITGQPRWLSGLKRSRVHSLMIARRSVCPEKLGSNPGQGSKGINFSGWHGLDMSITVTKRR